MLSAQRYEEQDAARGMVSLESTGLLIQFAQQLGAVLNENRQICLDGTPDNAITHAQVLMGT